MVIFKWDFAEGSTNSHTQEGVGRSFAVDS